MKDKDDKRFISIINRKIKSDVDKCNFIATLLGISGVLSEFITSKHNLKDIDFQTKYALFITSVNVMALVHDSEDPKINYLFQNMRSEDNDYKMSEQTQERIYRKMKEIIAQLHKHLNEESEL